MNDFFKQTTLPRAQDHGKPPLLPEKIGPYLIESLLVEGGMSYLYLGRHPERHLPLAIKVLSPRYMKHPEMTAQFLKEAKAIGRSDHPHIVKLYGQGEWDQGLYIAMEFVQGVSLKQFILHHSLSMPRALQIILQVAYALLHLHTLGIIHRDLKPENILITEEGEVKVIDFGIALLLGEDINPPLKIGTLLGTPSYMSPEQKKDPLKVTPTSDIYSLGIIAYELFMGKLSFGNLQLEYLPDALQKIIGKATHLDPKHRYHDIVDFIGDLSLLIKETPEKGMATLTDADERLMPTALSKTADCIIGIAKSKGQPCLWDLFQIDGVLAFTLLTPETPASDEAFALAEIKGMLRSILRKKPEPKSLIPEFDTLIAKAIGRPYRSIFLFLYPDKDRFEAILFGLPFLIHRPADSAFPRLLHSDNPLLGRGDVKTFQHMIDNWDHTDQILLHTDPKGEDAPFFQAFKAEELNAPQKLAEGMQKQLKSTAAFISFLRI